MNTYSALIVSLLAAACVDNLQTPETNVTPVAVARVLDDDRVMPSFSFEGSPLELTLDASKSTDLDGTIASYRWLSATQLPSSGAGSGGSGGAAGAAGAAGAGGASAPGRWVPEGEAADWPEDVERPRVSLPAPGTYSFVVWVTDNGGRISDPNTLTIEVTP
jgi:hypothetical protein